jgi:nickel-type superoxide dismutase maturation protease
MEPTLRPGDRLRVDPGAYRRRAPRTGEIVVLRDPGGRVPRLVKRVAEVDPSGRSIEVRGDDDGRSRDSRSFGPVAIEDVLGRAYRLYFPPDRVRDL